MPSVPLIEILSDFLPPNTIYLPVPFEPLPFPENVFTHNFAPKLPATLNALLEAYSAPTIPPINPQIVDLLDKVSITSLKSDVTWLTGERSDSVLQTRHSLSDDIKVATKWIKKRFQQAGCDIELFYHRDNYAPNVICKLKGTDTESDEVMVVSAHYDDRNTFPWKYGRAPGANDDASGTSLILSLLSVLSRNSSTNSTVSLTKTLYIVAFSGEEQGLLGSKAYAAHLRKNNANIILNIQADMVAYRKPGRELQLGFPKRYHTIEATELVKMIISQYMPSIVLGETPACCSDHQSFFEQGYPATAFFENNGPIQDPKYHNSGDIANRPGYDFEELAALTKAMIAVVGVVAGVYY
ncbi:hypothetical protein BKA69DRAFT_1028392 [Paraphysoderma sedebokerense]|nr:hypothetical protein BKA69DRAFT_1028392 [Paraphysoderma sedebokerense]